MAKSTVPKAGEPNSAAPDKREYRIKPGVEWVNGKRVGSAKTLSLTEAEAAYSLGNGHISPADKPEPAEWSKKATPAGNDDG